MSDWIWSSVYELIDARELAYETTQEMRNERAFPAARVTSRHSHRSAACPL
jgi:hypothetical protein